MSRVAAVLRHDLIALFGRSEKLYFAYKRTRDRLSDNTLVNGITDLCVEAPPGSGNSFFVQGFTMANSSSRVAHHHHVAAQVQRARRLKTPTLLILRKPADCVLSRAVSWQHPAAIGPSYREWISFWRYAFKYADNAVIADFSKITTDPSGAIKRLNERFHCDFSTDFPSNADVFAAMDRARTATVRSFDPQSNINPNRPDGKKDESREWLTPFVDRHRLAEPALRLYERVSSSFATSLLP